MHSYIDTTNSKKKILFVVTKSVWGGAGKYVYDLATEIPTEKFEVFVVAGGKGDLAHKLEKAGITYFSVKNFQRNVAFWRDFLAFFEMFFLFIKIHPDIVHVSSAKAGGIAGISAFFYKIIFLKFHLQSIFTVHGWTFSEDRPEWQIKLIKLFSKITCLFYTKIICVSEFDRQNAIKNKIAPQRKLVSIHNGIRPEDYNFLSLEEARQKLCVLEPKLKLKTTWLGSIGEFHKNKGYRFLIEAIEQLKSHQNINLIILGYGEDKAKLQKQIKKAKLDKMVSLFSVPPGTAPLYLKAFDLFISSSVKEGLPYVLLEAGLARLPVIATKVGGVPEIIDNKKNGLLVSPSNSKELSQAIKKLISKTNLSIRYPNESLSGKVDDKKTNNKNDMAFALWEKINREFSMQKMLVSTLAAYEKYHSGNKDT